jgi:hypothetical protein
LLPQAVGALQPLRSTFKNAATPFPDGSIIPEQAAAFINNQHQKLQRSSVGRLTRARALHLIMHVGGVSRSRGGFWHVLKEGMA